MAFTSGNDINILSATDSVNIGAAAGNDRYILSPGSALSAGQVINITDTQGINTLQLTGGLTITSSKISADALQLTLSNGATVNLLGANTFSFEIGGDPLFGTPGTIQAFSAFVTTSLGVAAVPTGATISSGMANVLVNANGTTSSGGTSVVPPTTIPVTTLTVTSQGGTSVAAPYDATTGKVTFNTSTASASYDYFINGFAAGDVIKFTAGSSISISNESFTDGAVDITATLFTATGANAVVVHLTGLATTIDAGLLGASSFNAATPAGFGAGTLG